MAEQKTEEKCEASFKVRYFGASGAAAPIRLALTLGGLAFIDEFVTGDEQKAAKESGTRRWSGLPELVVLGNDGKEITIIGQSKAQMRFVSKLTGLYPTKALDGAFVDEVLDSIVDAMTVLRYGGEKDKDKQKIMREAAIAKDGPLSYWLNKFVLRLEENKKRGNKNGYIVGDSLTIADIALTGALAGLISGFWDYVPKDYYSKNFPQLEAYVANVNKNDKIKAFNEKFAERLKDYKDDDKKESVKVVTYPGKKVDNITEK
eukprot:245908_1